MVLTGGDVEKVVVYDKNAEQMANLRGICKRLKHACEIKNISLIAKNLGVLEDYIHEHGMLSVDESIVSPIQHLIWNICEQDNTFFCIIISLLLKYNNVAILNYLNEITEMDIFSSQGFTEQFLLIVLFICTGVRKDNYLINEYGTEYLDECTFNESSDISYLDRRLNGYPLFKYIILFCDTDRKATLISLKKECEIILSSAKCLDYDFDLFLRNKCSEGNKLYIIIYTIIEYYGITSDILVNIDCILGLILENNIVNLYNSYEQLVKRILPQYYDYLDTSYSGGYVLNFETHQAFKLNPEELDEESCILLYFFEEVINVRFGFDIFPKVFRCPIIKKIKNTLWYFIGKPELNEISPLCFLFQNDDGDTILHQLIKNINIGPILEFDFSKLTQIKHLKNNKNESFNDLISLKIKSQGEQTRGFWEIVHKKINTQIKTNIYCLLSCHKILLEEQNQVLLSLDAINLICKYMLNDLK